MRYLLSLAAAVLLAAAAGAQPVSWNVPYNPSATLTWDTTSVSWLDGATPTTWVNSAVDPRTARFPAGSLAAGQVQAVNLTGVMTIGGLFAEHTGGTIKFTGAAFDKRGVNTVRVVDAAATVEFANTFGGGAWDKDGAGTVVFSAPAAYAGQVDFGNGTIRLAAGANTLPTSTVMRMHNGTTLDLNGNDQEVALIWSINTAPTTHVRLGGATLTVNYTNPTSSVEFKGVISGAGNFVNKGNGPYTLSGSNTYTGFTRIEGDLGVNGFNVLPTTTDLTIVGADLGVSGVHTVRSLSGSGATIFTVQGGRFTFGAGDAEPVRTFGGYFEGAGTFEKTGPGTTVVTGTSQGGGFGYRVDIHQGTLRVDGLLISNGQMTVGSGTPAATLGGSGRVAAPIRVTATGTVAPGASVGQLTVSDSFNLSTGGTYKWELGALGTAAPGTEFDQVVANGSIGSVVLGGTSKLTLDFALLDPAQRPDAASPAPFWLQERRWVILDWQGNQENGPTVAFGSITNPAWAAGHFSVVIGDGTNGGGPGDMVLVFTPVPEPAAVLAAAGLAATGWVRRRRAIQ